MDKFDIQVLLKDGTFADYQVENERNQNTYLVLHEGKKIASFSATEDGSWQIANNEANIDADMQQRIINQLNGFKG